MRQTMQKRRLLTIAFLLLAAICAYFLYLFFASKATLPVIKDAPDFTLQNWDGKTVQASGNAGKIVLMEFIFTQCPDICPVTTLNMVKMQEELKKKDWFGDKVRFVAVTFDPRNDTPDVLRSYAERMKMDQEGWHILRGDEDYTRQVASQYGISITKLGDGEFAHNVTSLTLIDARQRIRKVYKMGEEMDNAQILKDIESLVTEAAS